LSTVGGTTYDLDFALGTLRDTGGVNDLSVLVTVTSTSGALFSQTITGTDLTQNGWEDFNFNFTTSASDTSVTLCFTETSIDTYHQDLLLDNVSVTVVPEPATIGMLGLGALITFLIRRHTRS
jgi:hypothetical protein